jgi:hypothetical protein
VVSLYVSEASFDRDAGVCRSCAIARLLVAWSLVGGPGEYARRRHCFNGQESASIVEERDRAFGKVCILFEQAGAGVFEYLEDEGHGGRESRVV